MGKYLTLLLVALFFSMDVGKAQSPVRYQTIEIPPVNETAAVPGLADFIKRLVIACDKKDTAYVLRVVDEEVAVSYGGGLYGKAAFLEEFLRQGGGFTTLKEVLLLGGTHEQDEEYPGKAVYVFPYVQAGKLYKGKTDTLEIDPFLTAVGLERHLVVFKKPSLTAPQVGVLRYPLLKLDPDTNLLHSKWAQVATFDHKIKGYVLWEKLYHLAGTTLRLVNMEEGYRIVSVAPFD
ncbi:hypothetical protein [Rufibacter quisquiliarum]|uniref:Uncharacterized protein n=1 Tax=Rufibacter quisquiliarum TaxID=1549639 RepID=A0A839GY05_9BACT|nr:hypothetical protein [Rufibacter quisquiliarum]MBA9078581.1 hypothetical protein [Rufibacter quisquiliarum]